MKKITDGIRKHKAAPKKLGEIVELPEKTKGEEWLARFRDEEAAAHKETSREDVLAPEVHDEMRPVSRPFLFWGIVSGGVGVAIIAILLSTVFARVTVMVKPRVESATVQDLSVAVDASVSRPLIAQQVIPAEVFEFSKKVLVEFSSTGKEFIEEKAKGQVELYNQFSSSPQTLVGGTRFLTETGMLFRLGKTIVIPGAKIEEGKIVPEFVGAELAADKAGEESNSGGELKLMIPGFKGTAKYGSFYAIAKSGFSGGFRGEARVVSKEDIKKSEEQATKQAFDGLKEEISRKIPSGFSLLDPLREVQITKVVSPEKGTRGDNFTTEAEARGRAIVFRESDMRDFLGEIVLKGDKTRKIVGDSFQIEYRSRSVEYDKKRANLVVRGSVKTEAVIPKEEIAPMLAGKKEGSIVEVLKGREELASFNVAFFPPWLFSAPRDTAKIRFVGGE